MSLGPLMISLRGLALDADERRWLASTAVGGVILFSRNFDTRAQLDALVAEIRAVRSPHLLIAVDQEGGRVQRFREPFCRLPAMRALGRLHDSNPDAATRAAHQFGWLMAAELRASGIDLSFAPVVDIDRGLAPVIGDRALHGTGDVVAALACSFLTGARDAGMHVCAKHFPTHAGAVIDSHEAIAVDKRVYDELLDDLVPYRALIAHGLRSVMMAHVVFPDLDPLPASFSPWWIRTQLRSGLGFNGAVISDDISMAGAAGIGDHASRAVAAIEAGCDLVLLCNQPDAIPDVLRAVERCQQPVSQHRLIRLRGDTAPDWMALRVMPAWQSAVAAVAALDAAPPLELEG
jgi:beta-N-acetylhexosaminidase